MSRAVITFLLFAALSLSCAGLQASFGQRADRRQLRANSSDSLDASLLARDGDLSEQEVGELLKKLSGRPETEEIRGEAKISDAPAAVVSAGPDLRFVGLNTQGALMIAEAGFPHEVVNVGVNKTWKGYGTKLMDILNYAASIPDDTILVYVDGNDVVWGGCSRDNFMSTYRRIVNASGAPLVVGAEVVCGEQNCSNSSALPAWAVEREAQFASAVVSECNEQVKSDCRCDMPSPPECRNFEYTGADDEDWNATQHKTSLLSIGHQQENLESDLLFRYINSGFIMGPAADFRRMFQWAIFHYLTIKSERFWMHDQGAVAEYWRLNPSLVALDYRGELALSLPRLAVDTLRIDKSEVSGGNIVRNKLLNDATQCLIHNNVNEWNGGPRQQYWFDFFKQITAVDLDWERAA